MTRFSALLPGLFLGCIVLLGATTFSAPPARAESASQARENRTSHDRWARTSSEKKKTSDDDDEDDDTAKPEKPKQSVTASIHDGELNGNLHLKGW